MEGRLRRIGLGGRGGGSSVVRVVVAVVVLEVLVVVVEEGWDGWMEVKCVGSSDANTRKGNEKEEKIRLFGQHEGQTAKSKTRRRRDNEHEEKKVCSIFLPSPSSL